jgi:hypothetical protein
MGAEEMTHATPTAVGAALLGVDYESSGGSHINFLQPADTDSVMIELVERPDTRR